MIWDDMHGLNLRTTEDQSHSLRLIPGSNIILIIGFVLAFKRWYREKQFPIESYIEIVSRIISNASKASNIMCLTELYFMEMIFLAKSGRF